MEHRHWWSGRMLLGIGGVVSCHRSRDFGGCADCRADISLDPRPFLGTRHCQDKGLLERRCSHASRCGGSEPRQLLHRTIEHSVIPLHNCPLSTDCKLGQCYRSCCHRCCSGCDQRSFLSGEHSTSSPPRSDQSFEGLPTLHSIPIPCSNADRCGPYSLIALSSTFLL